MEPHVEEVRPLFRFLVKGSLRADALRVLDVQFEKRILKEADEFTERVRSRRSSESSSRRNSNQSSRRPSRRGSSSSGPNPLLSGLAGGQFSLSKISTGAATSEGGRGTPESGKTDADLDTVNQKLAKLDPNDDRMAQLDADPFADSDEEDEEDNEFDLNGAFVRGGFGLVCFPVADFCLVFSFRCHRVH